MAPEVKVQRVNAQFGATEDDKLLTAPGDFSAVGSLSFAFAHPTVNIPVGGYTLATVSTDQNQREMGAWARLSDVDEVTLSRLSTAANADIHYPFEIIEYTGESEGANEFIVRHVGGLQISSGTATGQIVLPTETDLTKCAAFPVGSLSNNGNSYINRQTFTVELKESGADKVAELARVDTGSTVTYYVAVIEFTGSNWVVQNNITHSFSTTIGDAEVSITDVANINKAFIASTFSGITRENNCVSCTARFKDSSTLYLNQESGADTGSKWIGAVVRNDSILQVSHYDSITGAWAEFPNNQNTVTRAISEVANAAHTMLLLTSSNNSNVIDPPQSVLTYRLSDVDEITLFCPRSGGTQRLAAQVVEFIESSSTQELLPSGASSTSTLGSTTVSTGAVALLSTGIASTVALGSAAVSAGAVSVSCSGIESTTLFGAATLSVSAVSVSCSGIESTTLFGTTLVSTAQATIAPTSIEQAVAYGEAQINLSIHSESTESSSTLGAAVVSASAVSITTSGIGSSEAFGTAKLSLQVFAEGAAGANHVSQPVVTAGTIAIVTESIEPVPDFGAAQIDLAIETAGIASSAVLGLVSLGVGAAELQPSSIASTSNLGTPELVSEASNIEISGIASSLAFGTSLVYFLTIYENFTSTPRAQQFDANEDRSFGASSRTTIFSSNK